MEAVAGDAEGSWVAGSSSCVVAAPSGAATVANGEPCEGGSGAEEAAGPEGSHALGMEVVLLDVQSGAAAETAVAADEEEAFGRMVANWREKRKERRENPNNLSRRIAFSEEYAIIACSHTLTN